MTEAQLQRLIFEHVRARGAPRTFLFHPMNGGIHQIGRRAGINSAMGVIPGVPDLIGVREGRFYALELKIENGRLPPGRLKLVTKPSLTGSSATMKTMGIVDVADLAAKVAGGEPTAITATLSFTSSSAC